MTGELLPCRNCGADLFELDAEETTATIEQDYEFGGRPAEQEVPAMVCPECGETTPL